MTAAADIPVVIVGAGPVGLATALVLGEHGVRSVVCEQHAGTNPHPRAHVVNTRSMELFRRWGIADGVVSDSVSEKSARSVVWRSTLTGEEFGRIDVFGDPARAQLRKNASPQSIVSCAQDHVQQRLADRVRAQGAATIRYGTRVDLVTQTTSGVTVSLDTNSGTELLTADYVVIADGASGSVSAAMGLDWDGLPPFGHQLNIYFHADLTPWLGDDPPVLVWVLNAAAPGAFIGMDAVRRWTFNVSFDRAAESLDDYPATRCVQLIRAAAGIDSLPVDVQSVGAWSFAARTAKRYRHGRIFLAGDAAHQFPPTGGLGMNTGLADADNLAWKLAAVLSGWAGDELLDSYEAERRPVALASAEHSVANALRMSEVGIGPTTVEVVRRLESPDPCIRTAERERLAAMIPLQRKHFDALEQEIGHIYPHGGTPEEPRIVEAATVGARLPHAWINRRGARCSTLDVIGPGYTMVIGESGSDWVEKFANSALGRRIRWNSVVVGRDIDPAGTEAFGVGETGATLVRPDGYVAWRSRDLTGNRGEHDLFPDALCPEPATANAR